MKHDPFGGSSIGRRAACPGSYHQEQEAEAQGISIDAALDAADLGTLAHSRVPEDQPVDDLPEDLRWAVNWVRGALEVYLESAKEIYFERQMALWDRKKLISFGTADCIGVFSNSLRVIEFKFGRGALYKENIEWQGKFYAACAMQEFNKSQCEVIVIQPFCGGEQFRETYKSKREIVKEIKRIKKQCISHPEDLRPSLAACQWCKAKAICPAFSAEVLERLPSTVNQLNKLGSSKLARALEFAHLVLPWAKQVQSLARDRLNEGKEIDGWTLGERNVREVPNVFEARKATAGWLDAKAFADCCTASVGDLERAFVETQIKDGTTTKKEAKERFSFLMKDVITTTTQTYLKRKDTNGAV